MAIVGARIWYHPRWFARRVPDPDIEGHRLELRLADGTLTPAGAPQEQGSRVP
jgi:RND superfamily putative drug exporter